MIIVPKEGGSVILKQINYIQPVIDAKLLSFHKYAPEHASLKSHVVLKRESITLYTGENLLDYGEECKIVAEKLLKLTFARYARVIQRFFKSI